MKTNSINLFDHGSRILANQILPEELVEPVLLIAKIKGFNSIDNYIVQLVREDLISIKDTGQTVGGEHIIKYLEKNVSEESTNDATTATTTTTKTTEMEDL